MKFSAEKNLINSDNSKNSAAFASVAKVLSGYQPGFDLTGEASPDAIERFVVLCVRGSPRLLLPPSPPLMRAAIKSFLGNRRFLAALVAPFIQGACWIGGPLSYLSTPVSLTSTDGKSSPLRELLANALGHNDFQIAMRLSFGRPNAKMVAMAISSEGEVLCFAKFGSEAMTNDLVAHESAILEQFEGVDMPLIIPGRLFSGAWVGGHNVLITAPLQMEPLEPDASSAHQAADAFASLNAVTTSALKDSAYWQQIGERVAQLEDSGNGKEPLSTTVARIEQAWGDSIFDFGASHGDWSRANLGLVDGRVAALDWERCTELSPRGIDIAHFAICEITARAFKKSFDIEHVAKSVRQYLHAAGQPPEKAEALLMFAMLEMVIRFKSAQNVGLRSADSKFRPALQAGLKKWAV